MDPVADAGGAIYTHMQMQIFQLAYQTKKKEGQIHKLKDDTAC